MRPFALLLLTGCGTTTTPDTVECNPACPPGGTCTGQGTGAAEPAGQKAPRPQLRVAQDAVPGGQ